MGIFLSILGERYSSYCTL